MGRRRTGYRRSSRPSGTRGEDDVRSIRSECRSRRIDDDRQVEIEPSRLPTPCAHHPDPARILEKSSPDWRGRLTRRCHVDDLATIRDHAGQSKVGQFAPAQDTSVRWPPFRPRITIPLRWR